MHTKIMAQPGVRFILMSVMGAALVISSFFMVAVPKAHAAALTEPQIQAILNMLVAFNVPAATVANVNAILHKSK